MAFIDDHRLQTAEIIPVLDFHDSLATYANLYCYWKGREAGLAVDNNGELAPITEMKRGEG